MYFNLVTKIETFAEGSRYQVISIGAHASSHYQLKKDTSKVFVPDFVLEEVPLYSHICGMIWSFRSFGRTSLHFLHLICAVFNDL